MKCDICEIKMVERKSTNKTPYLYKLSGLKNVGLVGISVWKCPKCKGESPIIPKIGELHDVIMRALILKSGLLMGDEVKFLRKNVGLPAKEFAALLSIDPSHLSRFENGKTKVLGPPTDKLVRAVVTASSRSEFVREVLLQHAEKLIKVSTVFRLEKNHWRQAA